MPTTIKNKRVMDVIQVMRRRAQQAGNLNSTSQQTVTAMDSDVEIESVNPEVVYVPAYDPWIVYGGPIVAWPGWYPYPGIWYDGPSLFFGVGFGIGFFGGYGWGWHHWGFDWHHHYAVFDHARYRSPSRTFYNRDAFYRGGGTRDALDRSARAQPFGGDRGAARGYAEPRVRAEFAPALSAATVVAERSGVFPRAKRQLRRWRRLSRRRPPLSVFRRESSCSSFLTFRTGESQYAANEAELLEIWLG